MDVATKFHLLYAVKKSPRMAMNSMMASKGQTAEALIISLQQVHPLLSILIKCINTSINDLSTRTEWLTYSRSSLSVE